MTHFAKNNGCSSCGDKKADCHASPAVLQINNPSECVIFHKTVIPASMGDETTIPPVNGAYKNMLVYYEGSGAVYLYSSDGIPTLINYTDYVRLTNKPSINGVVLIGNKTLAELGININDATLTIKQGDTTLGTFSANANENVEINIPEGNNALSFTMQYTAGTIGFGFPDWSHFAPTELITKTIYDSDVRKMAIGWSGSTEYPVTFLNDATGETITPQDLYALLLDGADVTLNHVPLGWMLTGEAFQVDPYCDGVHLTKYFTSVGDSSYTGFGGSASVSLFFPNVNGPIQVELGFSIAGYEDEGNMVFDYLTAQGLYAA